MTWTLAAAAIGAIGVAAWVTTWPPMTEFGPIEFRFATTKSERIAWNGSAMIALSPDARATVYSSRAHNTSRLMVRRLSDAAPREIPGTAGAYAPFFSADGRFLFYGLGGKLVRTSIEGSERAEIASVGRIWRGSASRDLMVLSASDKHGAFLATLPTAGGELRIVSRPDTIHGEREQVAPLPLPDARHLVYSSIRDTGGPSLTVMSLDGAEKRPLRLAGLYPLAFLEGHLIYVRPDGVVAAVPLDGRSAAVTGPPIATGDTISLFGGWIAAAALAANGSLVYAPPGSLRQLTLVDPAGGARPLTTDQRRFAQPRFSPDGARVLAIIDGDVWTYEIAAAKLARITVDSTIGYAEWSRSGQSIYYVAGKGRNGGLWSRDADGGAGPQRVVAVDRMAPFAMGPNGRSLAYTSDSGVIIRSLAEGSSARLPGSDGLEIDVCFSPDGQLLAYSSLQSGKLQVYVRPVASPGPRVQVSTGTGGEPRWSRDGAYLFFRDGESFRRARVLRSPKLAADAPELLFDDPYDWDAFDTTYDLSPDGSHFLMLAMPDNEGQITMVLNWIEGLRNRLQRR